IGKLDVYIASFTTRLHAYNGGRAHVRRRWIKSCDQSRTITRQKVSAAAMVFNRSDNVLARRQSLDAVNAAIVCKDRMVQKEKRVRLTLLPVQHDLRVRRRFAVGVSNAAGNYRATNGADFSLYIVVAINS